MWGSKCPAKVSHVLRIIKKTNKQTNTHQKPHTPDTSLGGVKTNFAVNMADVKNDFFHTELIALRPRLEESLTQGSVLGDTLAEDLPPTSL